MSKKIVFCAIAIALIATAVWLLTRGDEEPFRPVERSEIDDPAQLDELHLELADLDPSSWVRRYRPGRASSGFNLVLYRRRVPMIIDMNGNIVHLWPKVRAIGRARLHRDGRLAVIGTDNLVKEYDWDGNLTWFFQLPRNRWFDAGDDRFRPGNILVSGRYIDTIFIIDRPTGEVVWTYSDGLDRQHEAVMVSEDLLDAGLILVFNNGLEDRFAYRTSAVQAIDPVPPEVVWEHRSENFFSSVGGTAQPLPKNTILISSSQGRRVFEITGDGRFVWEWAPPFKPMRVGRVPYDYCPQLAALERTPETRVRPKNRQPYIDHDLYRFEFLPQTEKRVIDGREKHLLRSLDACRELLMPVGPTFRVNITEPFSRSQGVEIWICRSHRKS